MLFKKKNDPNAPLQIAVAPNEIVANIWTGTGDWWSSPTNWSPAMIPINRTNVTIPPVSNQPVISTTGNKCLDVTIQPGASLQINPGKDLMVGGNISLQP